MKAGMVALLPRDPEQLVVPGGIPADQIHLTLAFLGEDVTGWDDTRRQLLEQLVWSAAHSIGEPITARVMGHATFNPDGHDGRQPCAVHLAGDSDRLVPVHDQIGAALAAALGDDYPTQHSPFLPHITAGEGLSAANLAFTGSVVFDRIALALAGEWTIAPITTDPAVTIASYARSAFAQGWARSGGPMTDVVHAGCVAAVELAMANAADPHVLEATLRLGSLEGTWALVYERREALVAQHLVKVATAWRHSAHRIHVGVAVRRLRQSLGLEEYIDTDNTEHRRLVANAIAATVVSTIAGPDAAPEDREAIINATADALVDAEAEGYTAAVLVGAEQLGVSPPAADVVMSDYQAQLADLGSHWADANGWVGKMVQGNAADLGGRLSQLVMDGAGFDEMAEQAADIIGGDDIRAVSTLLDLAMGQSFSRGALALYGREGVTQVDFVTAGGANVCPACQRAEDNSPWDRAAVPVPPLHPYCVVGSTKVAVPGFVVPGDEPAWLAGDPAFAGVGFGGDAGVPAASAVAVAERDFGRRNIRAVAVREYVGDVVVIRTASGKELTGTPNHPVATRSGWVGLAELHVGDYVLTSHGSEWVVDAIDPDVDHVPPCIQQVAESLPVAFGSVPTSAEDFHGDGAGSEVCVIRSDGFLVDDRQLGGAPQHAGEVPLGHRHVAVDDPLSGFSSSDELRGGAFASPDGVMGGSGKPGSFLGGGLSHPCAHARAAVAHFHTCRSQTPSEGQAADREGFCQRLHTFTSEIATDDVVHVERRHFAGHVYNLDTVGGWYLSNGIVSHNCRCNLQATNPMEGLTGLLNRFATSA